VTSVAILGAGAFGTALAIALGRAGHAVTLWARDADAAEAMQARRLSGPRLPGWTLPPGVTVTGDLARATADIQLLAVPMQELAGFLEDRATASAPRLVACMKGLDLSSGEGPVTVLARHRPKATVALLTGPSFAADIAGGLPTALTLACGDIGAAEDLQAQLSTPALRLYRTADVAGAELGGALKNVIALAAGIAIGQGLGDSARAAVIARGMAEIARIAGHFGAEPATLMGLSGLGDLVLTATSPKSRNYNAGCAIGRGAPLPEVTIEGIATARAMARTAARLGLDAPLVTTVAAVTSGELTVPEAIDTLLARPLKEE